MALTQASGTRTEPRRPSRKGTLTALLFLAPFFVLFFAFTVFPVLYSCYLSLFKDKAAGLGLGAVQKVFVGGENYLRALTDPAYTSSFGNIAVYCLIYIPVMIVLSLSIALLLDSAAAKARGFFRLAFYLPNIVPGLIAAVIWLYLYTPEISPIVDAVKASGGTWDLSSTLAAYFSISNITVWMHTGYNVILFYAALQAVPKEVLEAATVDGAGPFRTAVAIKARMIAGAVSVATLFTVVGAMQLFAEPLLLKTKATAITSTWTPNMFIYDAAFDKHDFGYAAASALTFAVLIGVMSWAVTKLGSKADQ
ncbi:MULTISPECIES: sugar ABC transporter permease [Arthrobacter]|uniref:Sugar ABC transporter permease n=2 Tax=Arthrobacter TaxID=1663 RepID=A0ABU9KKE8_9MICC|nr:sugar ABC transporter permease [Arthrobacter sp. YJM1]MDP5227317.1 sugar ABC transporter permease [Arthrobacter sp. YJM1]